MRKWQPYKSIIVNRQKPSKDKKLLLNLSVITFYWWWLQMWCSWQLLRWCWWWWWDGFPYNRYFSCFCRHINCKCNKVRYMIIVFRSLFGWYVCFCQYILFPFLCSPVAAQAVNKSCAHDDQCDSDWYFSYWHVTLLHFQSLISSGNFGSVK